MVYLRFLDMNYAILFLEKNNNCVQHVQSYVNI